MNTSTDLLVHRYALAYINTAGCILDKDIIKALNKLTLFCKEHRSSLYITRLVSVPVHVRMQALLRLVESFGLLNTLSGMIKLLTRDRRGILLGEIAQRIIYLCQKNSPYTTFKVTSALELSDDRQDQLVQFIERKTGTKARLQVTIDPSLIAGIRIQSEQLLWEYSIKKELRLLSRPITR